MRSEVKNIIEKEIKKYKVKEIKIFDKKYPLYILPQFCDEDLNIFEGLLFVEAENRSEVSYLKNKYRPPVSGYTPRLGIIFYNGHLLIKDYRRNRHIIKTFRKINKTFLNKLKKALSEPGEENFNKLFDRTDVIEEFYILYKKAREYLLKNISGIPEEEKREEFVDNFMMQMLTLWYLQERGFFNNDKNYFITGFKELKQKKLFDNFKNYYEFLTYLFEKISGNLNSQYYEDKNTGKVVVIGPAVFLNGEHSKAISIPDKCFYKEGMTDILINTPPKKVSQEVPLLNLFESRDWTEGNIDEFVLGAIYEKLITYMERKKLGAYYTPEEITSYICKNTIEPYLVDRVNEEFNKNFENIDQIIESNDRNILLYLFEQLKEIKILDPAVGSAHFLESAINVLVSIYEKIWDKAKELSIRKGFEIIATDEKGEIKKINLLEISNEDKFKLLVKFFIILSKNIYGVDINPSALKVAKARLFLSLAKHFRTGKEKDIFIRFPNVHFNLRESNSLIGYVEIGKEKAEKPIQLELFVKEKQTEYITKRIKVVSTLKAHLEKTAKALKINGDIVKEIEELNKILSKNKINRDDFEKVLRIKGKLIKILIASLNSQYAVPLNDLLREITDLFNQKLDEKFAEEHNIELKDLKKIKTFHWVFEFPEVFLDRGGFDVVVGNPPYGEIHESQKLEKSLYKVFYAEVINEHYDIFMFFIYLLQRLSRFQGYVSYIVSMALLENVQLKSLRKFLSREFKFQEVILAFNIFNNTQDNVIFICKNKKPIREKYSVRFFVLMRDKLGIRRQDERVVSFEPSDTISIETFIKTSLAKFISGTKGVTLGQIFNSTQGITVYSSKLGGKLELSKEELYDSVISNNRSNGYIKPLLKGEFINRYHLDLKTKLFLNYNPNYLWCPRNPEYFENNKVILRQTGKRLVATYDNAKFYTLDSIHCIIHNDESLLKMLTIFLNSKFCNYYYRNFLAFIETRKTVFSQIKLTKIRKIIISSSLIENADFLKLIADVLLFLNATEERRQKLEEMIEFFDRQIADSLVYELYFKEKFAEDGVYPKPKEYLLTAVSRHLKPINYDRWAELYWKKQLDGNLIREEENEFKRSEKENMKTINEVYNILKEDAEIQMWIEKIKSHKWIKVIEGE